MEVIKEIRVLCDSRELKSHVPMELEKLGANIEIIGNMLVADFVVTTNPALKCEAWIR